MADEKISPSKSLDPQHIEHGNDDLIKEHMNYDRVDAEVAKYASTTAVVISPEENKRLKMMVDKRVLSIMIFTYFLQAIDKGTMSFTIIMGVKQDAHISETQFPWLTTCIYIAILVVEYPTNLLIQRLPIAKYLGISIILWGMVLALHSIAKNFTALVILRTILGILEAVCQPAFVYLSSMWYKREEQAATVSYWYMMNGAQQIVGGLLAYCFSLIKSPPSPLKSWQAIFIAYGAFSVLWGVVVLVWMPDSPMRAKCFSEEDKKLLVERVRSNQTGVQNKQFRKEQMWEAFKDPQMYCYCLIAFCTTLPTSGLGAFANLIIKGFNFSLLQTQLLAMVLGAYIIIVLLSSMWLVKKTGQNLIIMLIYVIPSFAGTIVLMTVENTGKAQQAGLLISYYIVLSFWAAQTLGMSMISRNIGGQTKKTVVVAANFVSWSAGNAIGPQVFLEKDKPRYLTAFATHMACYGLLVFVIIFLRWYLKRQNGKKDRLQAEFAAQAGTLTDERMVHAFDDLTDRENLSFRYVY
ncbi:MFS general substrate transporter [Venustampulla echinocandica]|uniref:MFS general substrate transporter n=1 Tax=Venustampulla echinocandica TaxID=2656787 RepID=A0A370TTJ0_9HELO|nr:MFS general substrate transporter [Venustampulla echinocandica]RDL38852.1 MFS general substrate transporter [Venustampulla echinocandica]